jgi:hypothetical protein
LRQETEKAIQDGDDVMTGQLLEAQDREAFKSLLSVTLDGGDPFSQTTPGAAFIHPQIELKRRLFAEYQSEAMMDKAMEDYGYWDVKDFENSTMALFKERNKAPLAEWKEGMSRDDQIAFMRQLEPVVQDPNVVAEQRQTLVKLDQAMKTINPKFSVFTHPKTRDLAMWLNTESTPYTPGHFVSGAQPVDYGAGVEKALSFLPDPVSKGAGMAMQANMEAFKGVTGLAYNLGEGVGALALMGLDRITDNRGEDYWNIPTSFIVDNTGEVVHNGGKVHPNAATELMVWNRLFYDDVEKTMESYQKAEEWETAQRHGMNKLVLGMSHLGGSLIGFGPAAKAWQGGSATAVKGLQWLGALGWTANQGPRAKKIIEIVAKTSGAAVAGGTVDGVAYGRHEGFGKAFANGVVMTPLYLALGAMGRGSERWLKQKKMPKKIAQAIAGGMEGAGLGTMEVNNLSPLWRFIQDPNEKDWGEYGMVMMKNILTLAAVKTMGKGFATPSETAEGAGLVGGLSAD